MNAQKTARLVVLDTRTSSLLIDKLIFLDDNPAETMARYTAQYPDEHHKLFAISTDQAEAQLPAPQLAEQLKAMLAESQLGWRDKLKAKLAGLFSSGLISTSLLGSVLLATGLPGCAAAASQEAPPSHVVDALIDGQRTTVSFDDLADRVHVPATENIVVVPIGKDAHTSHALVGVRDRETLHVHNEHDLTVLVLRGRGHMYMNGDQRPVTEGSLIYIPRSTVHAFRNAAEAPSIAYAIFSPPHDGTDHTPVRPRE